MHGNRVRRWMFVDHPLFIDVRLDVGAALSLSAPTGFGHGAMRSVSESDWCENAILMSPGKLAASSAFYFRSAWGTYGGSFFEAWIGFRRARRWRPAISGSVIMSSPIRGCA